MKMTKREKKIKSKERKIFILGIIFFVLLTAFVTIPTLSSYKNRNLSQSITVWDGTIAETYRSGAGTKDNPYIIANGGELAYFASQLQTTNYEGKYFKLSNNIVLNEGIFNYDDVEGIKYIKDNSLNVIIPNLDSDVINKFQHLNKFKGTFDGDYYTIFGIYIDEVLEDGQNALFTNLEGNIKNLYIENSIIYGGKVVAGVASKTNGVTLSNVLYDGYVISDEESSTGVIEENLEDINLNVQDGELNDNLYINNLKYIPGLIIEVILSGNYVTDNLDGILKINGENISAGDFEITLGNKLLKTLPINYHSSLESNISLTNLKYQVKYNYSNASGIISIAENTILQNVINKANISAGIYASGIINFVNGTTKLKNVYNTGKIDGDIRSSGIISGINQNEQDTTIVNCYNDGQLNSDINSMIGNIEYNLGNVTLDNVFNPQDNYVINLVEESNVSIKNSYVVTNKFINSGIVTGEFIQTTRENLEDKTFILEKLQYKEFNEDENNEELVWLFEDNSLPKMFIDYQVANIYIGDYKWDKYKNTLNTLNFSKKFVFSIEETNELNTIKEMYYYISNAEDALTKNDLNEITDWTKYEKIVEINTDGIYTIYVKIVDYDDNITYINTDLIMLDLTGASITISTSLEDESWNTLKEDLNNYYIDEEISIAIDAEDLLSGVKEVYYYTTDIVLTLEQLKIKENWNQYNGSILITNKKTIIYVKVIDNCGNVTYANSDLIVIDGYTLDALYPGMNGEVVDNLYITQNSSVSLKFSYQDTTQYESGNKHQIITNVLLPENTIITIIDKINDKVYKYITTNDNYGYDGCLNDNCYAIYDFELFNEVGTTNKFQESNYTGIINEEFIIYIDFNKTEVDENIENILVSLRLFNEDENKTKNTVQSTMKNFNINSLDNQAYFTLTSQFKDTIKYSEDEKYTVDFSTKLNYKYIEEFKIFDTTFEDKTIGLAIKLLSSDGEIIEKRYLKNILFMIGENKYLPSSDGIVRINLDKGIKDIDDDLIIQTFKDNSKLEKGNYKFEVSLYAAYDGKYSTESLAKINIPVYVGENIYKNDISFNVLMDNEDKIIATDINEFNFNFLLSDNISDNSNIKISLYKKNLLSAYDQNYTLVDLGDYLVNNTLDKYEENIYYAVKDIKNNDNLNINLNTSLLEKNGYMFIFELYEEEKIVSKINKKFVVK